MAIRRVVAVWEPGMKEGVVNKIGTDRQHFGYNHTYRIRLNG